MQSVDRYYKIDADDPIAQQILQLFEKFRIFKQLRQKFCKQYHIYCTFHSEFDLCGVSYVLFEDGIKPDMNIWKKVYGGYYPRKKPKLKAYEKQHQQLINDFRKLDDFSVERFEIDRLLGGIDPFLQCGVNVSNPCFVLINTDKSEIYDLPLCCVEISQEEWRRLGGEYE